MALPEFVRNATSLDDGAANSLAAGLAKMRRARYDFYRAVRDVDDVFNQLDPGDLPLLPSSSDILTESDNIESEVNTKIGTLEDLGGLAGTCLTSGVSAATSIAKNAFGFIEDAVDAYAGVTNMPSEMFDIYKIYGAAQEFVASLGVDKMVEDINNKLGCISDSSMIADVQAEVADIVWTMGLDDYGRTDPDTYYDMMKRELADLGTGAGIGTGFTDEMADGLGIMTAKTNDFATTSADAAKAEIDNIKQSIKDSIPSSLVPPTYY